VGNSPNIVLDVPADARFLVIARAVVAGAAAGLELPYDAVDDLRIAVDEAISLLLALPAPKSRIAVDVRPDVDGLRMRISSDAAEGPWPPEGVRELDGLAWRIITHLVDDAVAGSLEGRPSIELLRRTLSAGPS
jgi:serine/threonine-protein kinase RsbW